jgi:hypothetical protein
LPIWPSSVFDAETELPGDCLASSCAAPARQRRHASRSAGGSPGHEPQFVRPFPVSDDARQAGLTQFVTNISAACPPRPLARPDFLAMLSRPAASSE